MNKLNIPLLILSLSISGCGGIGKSNLAPPTPLREIEASVRIESLWSREIGSAGERFNHLQARLAGNYLYTLSAQGQVYAYNLNGGERWQRELNVPASGGMGYGNNMALLGTREGDVFALRHDTGEEIWRARVSSEVLAPPVAASGVVVVQTQDGTVYGLSAKNGKRLWRFQNTVPALSLRGTSQPNIQGGLVITGFANGTIVGLDLHTGRKRWQRVIAGARGRTELDRMVDVDGSPIVVGYRLFAASYQGRVEAMDMRSGRSLWARKMSSYVPLAADKDTVFVVEASGEVIALSQQNGAEKWRQKGLRSRFLSSPAVIGDYLAIGDREGYIHLLNRSNGKFAARTRLGSSAIANGMISRNDRLYVSNQSGQLTAYRVSSK